MNTDRITVNTQSSIRIDGTAVLYFDPFEIRTEAHDADIIFLTHSHYDHYDPKSIRCIAKDSTVLVIPETIKKEVEEFAGVFTIVPMTVGEEKEIAGVKVKTVPAYNRLKPFHPKHNRWVGYVVETDGMTCYIAGDTDAVREIDEVRCDAAIIPIGGKYTMNAKEAAGLINRIRPAVVIPTHYGSIVGKPQDVQEFGLYVDKDIQVVQKLSF